MKWFLTLSLAPLIIMPMNYLLYNSLSSSLKGEKIANEIISKLSDRFPDLKPINLLKEDKLAFVNSLKEDDNVVIAGGDGTLNHFINDIDGKDLVCPFYLFSSGTGNDFAKDNEEKKDEDGLIKINDLMHDLPIVEVKGKKYRFFNGAGLGIDGDTCAEANRQKAKGKEKISYIGITLNLILNKFESATATIEVNGETLTVEDTFLASAMYGKYFGGGVLIAEKQRREDRKLTLVIAHVKGRIRTLLALNKVNKGKSETMGKQIIRYVTDSVTIKFSKPHALQIDGEVVEDVTEYKAYINK